MKHQRTPIMIEDSSDDESLSQGPLFKRQKRTGMAPALTLLIRAGDLLKEEQDDSESIVAASPRALGRVTPTKEIQDTEDTARLNRKLVQRALTQTLTACEEEEEDEPQPTSTRIPESSTPNEDWRKFCRPLAAPPRLPNVPCGFKCS
ncbi:MAG: hypothetical protein SGBAC_005834 [Bacillariaceae sp.]